MKTKKHSYAVSNIRNKQDNLKLTKARTILFFSYIIEETKSVGVELCILKVIITKKLP